MISSRSQNRDLELIPASAGFAVNISLDRCKPDDRLRLNDTESKRFGDI
jgi:hypothetical protein